MRVFVAGATGVVGRRLVPLLVQAGHDVSAIGRSPAKRETLARQGANAVDVSLFDGEALRRALLGHEAVINMATHIPSSTTRMMLPWGWRENDHIRREGATTIAEAARAAGAARFIQESFAPIYEDGGDRWLDEQWPLRPVRYNRSVLQAEEAATRFGISGGAGIVLRFSSFYGADSPLLHEMVGMIRKGWSPLPGDPSSFISSISHDDAASAVVAALSAPGGVYNVTDNEPVTRHEWVDTLADALALPHPKPMPRWLTRLGGAAMELLGRSQRMSNAKLRHATGWAPRWSSVRDAWPSIAPELGATPPRR